MAHFLYQARDGRGQLATGTVMALTIEDASKMLRAEGKFIVKLNETRNAPEVVVQAGVGPRTRVGRRDVIVFAHQLAVMVETGVPLSDALQCAAEQCINPQFKAVLTDVTTTVQAGTDLSTALRKYPRVFPEIMVSLIKASEATGTMGQMLERVCLYLGKEAQTLRQARGAMMYPAFMMFMAVSVTVFLLAFVLPKFTMIYASRGAALPGPTRLLMATSDSLVHQWYLWVGAVVSMIVTVVVMRRTVTGRRLIDWVKIHTPVIGKLFRELYLTRATRTMGTMISAGVSMLDMIAITRQVTVNHYFQMLWDDVDDRLRKGAQLSDAFFASPLVPRSISQMVYSGERSGRLGKVLNRIAEFTEAEFDGTVKTTTQFIEPVMVVAMGGLIGFVAISLLLPIFSVGKVVSGH